MKRILIPILLAVLTVVISCKTEKPQDIEGEINSIMKENLRALEEEDIDAYMATIHNESPLYEQTKKLVEEIFKTYDLEYKIEKSEILEKSDQEVSLEFVQVTGKLTGPEFKNNRVTGINLFKKHRGKWKIFDTKVQNIEYLD